MNDRDKEIFIESAIKVTTFCITGISLTTALVAASVGIVASTLYHLSNLINKAPEGKEDGWMYRSPIDIIKAVSNYKGNSSSSTGEGNDSAVVDDSSTGECEDIAEAEPTTDPLKEGQLHDTDDENAEIARAMRGG